MGTARKPWDPRFQNADQEIERIKGLTRAQIEMEHMEQFAACLNYRARLEDSKMPENKAGTKRNAWAMIIKRLRPLANAMRDAIEARDMVAGDRAVEAWDGDHLNAKD